MFRINTFRRQGVARTLAITSAFAATLALAGSAAGADWPWRNDRGRHDHRHGGGSGGGVIIQPRIVIGGGPRVVFPSCPPVVVQRCDAVPSNLRISAYQSRDTVILVV